VWREDDRVRIGEALNVLGCGQNRGGHAIISEENRLAIKRLKKMHLKSEIVAFCRAIPKDLDAAIDVGVDRIIVEHAVNPYLKPMCTQQQGRSRRKGDELHQLCQKNGVKVSFMGWDATRSSLDYVLDTFLTDSPQRQPETVAFVDSFGVGTPQAIQFAFEELRKVVPENIGLEFMCTTNSAWPWLGDGGHSGRSPHYSIHHERPGERNRQCGHGAGRRSP